MRNNLSYTTKLLMGLSLISMAVLTILMIDRFTMIRKLSEERATNNISTLGVILSEEIADDLGDGDMAQARKTLWPPRKPTSSLFPASTLTVWSCFRRIPPSRTKPIPTGTAPTSDAPKRMSSSNHFP